MKRLMRCPCCGGEADYIYTPSQQLTDIPTYPLVHVACSNCGIQTNAIVYINDEAKAQAERELEELWNRRPEPFVVNIPKLTPDEQIEETTVYLAGVTEQLRGAMLELRTLYEDTSERYKEMMTLLETNKGGVQ